jgi:hypothetical protein
MFEARAYSATGATSPLASTKITRRDATEHDVEIEILFSGICHSDLHQVRNEWSEFMPTVYSLANPGRQSFRKEDIQFADAIDGDYDWGIQAGSRKLLKEGAGWRILNGTVVWMRAAPASCRFCRVNPMSGEVVAINASLLAVYDHTQRKKEP